MTKNKRTVTILIPCYNEEESLPMLFARLTTLSENAQLVLAGIQLLALGVIGEYLGRTFIQTKNRPSYLIEEEQRPKER